MSTLKATRLAALSQRIVKGSYQKGYAASYGQIACRGLALDKLFPSLTLTGSPKSNRRTSSSSPGSGDKRGSSRTGDADDPFGLNFEDSQDESSGNIGPKDELPPNYIRDAATGKFTGRIQAEISSFKSKRKTDSDPDKGTVTLKLKTPIVLDLTGVNNIAIMIDRKLVASLSVSEGSLSIPVVYPDGTDHSWSPTQYEIVNDLIKYEHVTPTFNNMLTGINFRQKRTKREVYEYPDVTKVNRTSNISGDDFRGLIESMSYKSDADSAQLALNTRMDIGSLLIENIASEFHESTPRFNGEGNLTMDGLIRKDMMVKFIDKFVQKLFTCPSCRGTRCTLTRVDGTVHRHCHNCPSVTSLHTTNIGKIAN